MDDAATRKDVAEMSDKEMVDELARMFDVEALPDTEQDDQPAEEVEATVEDDEATSEETEADDDTEVEATEEDGADEAEDSDDDSKWMPGSLEELAEALETEPERVLESLKVKIKTDGKEGEATLKDVVANYQIRKTLDQRLEAYANERKSFEEQSSGRLQQLDAKLKDADDTVGALESLLFQEYQGINWGELKADDPTEYMLKQQEMRDRYMSLQEAKSTLKAQRESEVKKQQEEFQKTLPQIIQKQVEMSLQKIPEWKDEGKRNADLTAMKTYLINDLGFTEQDVASVVDHRVVAMALKAMRYDSMQTKADPKLKQMKTKPKFAKPGARKDPGQTSAKKKQAAFDRAKKVQTDDAWAEALLAKLS